MSKVPFWERKKKERRDGSEELDLSQ